MSVEYILFVLRIIFIFVLYFFILLVARTMSRELTTRPLPATGREPAGATGYGAMVPGRAYLVLVDGAESGIPPGTTFSVQSGDIAGRGTTSPIALPDAYTSSEHARFRYERERWLLEDLGSMNGSYINGQRLQGTMPLSEGDTVQLGRVVLQWMLRQAQ